jgi:hypothetical protein
VSRDDVRVRERGEEGVRRDLGNGPRMSSDEYEFDYRNPKFQHDLRAVLKRMYPAKTCVRCGARARELTPEAMAFLVKAYRDADGDPAPEVLDAIVVSSCFDCGWGLDGPDVLTGGFRLVCPKDATPEDLADARSWVSTMSGLSRGVPWEA